MIIMVKGGEMFRKALIFFVLLLSSGCAAHLNYSPQVKKDISTRYLKREVILQKSCLLVERVIVGAGIPLDTLYDDKGEPTDLIKVDYNFWATGFRKPDYRVGVLKFYKVTGYPRRSYYLIADLGKDYTHQYFPDLNDSKKAIILGPYKTHLIAKGTAIFVQGFKNYSTGACDSLSFDCLSDNGSDVAVEVLIPGTDKKITASCPIDEFPSMVESE